MSQDIILQLCNSLIEDKNIGNMDAYIYRICSYTWSNYIRKNKPQWEALNHHHIFGELESADNIEEAYIKKDFIS